MREIQVVKWCDICFQEGNKQDTLFVEKAEATHTFTIGCIEGEGSRPTPKVLDVCDVHAKQFADLIPILHEVGQLPQISQPSPPPAVAATKPLNELRVNCPVCDERVMRNTIIPHVWKAHVRTERPPIPSVCPECKEKFQAQGMALHRKANHGVDPLVEALTRVDGYKVTGREREELEASAH